jgi:hypothetical protein
MPKIYQELSEDAKITARRILRRDRGYRQASEQWERECAEGGIQDFLEALGFTGADCDNNGISGEYSYKKSADVKKDLDNCAYASPEIYEWHKRLIAVQRRHQFDLSALMRHGEVRNVWRGNRYEDISDFEDLLYDLDLECAAIVRKNVEWVVSDEYLDQHLEANCPGGFNDDGTEYDPYGIYSPQGIRIDELPEDVDPYVRQFRYRG